MPRTVNLLFDHLLLIFHAVLHYSHLIEPARDFVHFGEHSARA